MKRFLLLAAGAALLTACETASEIDAIASGASWIICYNELLLVLLVEALIQARVLALQPQVVEHLLTVQLHIHMTQTQKLL